MLQTNYYFVTNFFLFYLKVHYLMCLSANYAHIRDHEKFEELQELQLLQDTDFAASKERF